MSYGEMDGRGSQGAGKKAKGVDEKPDFLRGASFWTWVGEIVDLVVGAVGHTTTFLILGWFLFFICLSLSANGFLPVASAVVEPFGGFSYVLAPFLAVGFALGILWLQISPNYHKYFPKAANRRVVKEAFAEPVQARETAQSSTMLPKANKAAMEAAEKSQRSAELFSWAAYAFETVIAFNTYTVFAAGSLNFIALFCAAAGIRGTEQSLIFIDSVKARRLTVQEERALKNLEMDKKAKIEGGLS